MGKLLGAEPLTKNEKARRYKKKYPERVLNAGRVRRWRQNPLRSWTIYTSENYQTLKLVVWVPREVSAQMRKWISEEEIMDAVVEAARRNGWLKRPDITSM